jgi:3',5'-cyclic AMP phosphodiesterase CpdA
LSDKKPEDRPRLFVIAMAALTAVALMVPLWPVQASARAEIGIKDQYKITRLIYPTLGNPALAPRGTRVVIEYDPREQEFNRRFEQVAAFKAVITSTNDPFGVTVELPVEWFEVDYSRRWPEYARSDTEDRRIYLVTVAVPRSAPCDLFDLRVRSMDEAGVWTEDMQPHALQVIDGFKDTFSFCQLTDIHIWGPECYYPSCTYHERSQRPDGSDPNRKGAIYYRKAIDQINRMKPDFCVFTGDYMFGQAYFEQDQGKPWGVTTEYEYEMLWFYEETMRLEVPVFMAIGNHDGYNEGGSGAKEDWQENWRKLYGPLYYSFDYGDCHFLVLNSLDWSAEDRVLEPLSDIALVPTKYKGQFRERGDEWKEGFSLKRLEELKEGELAGQLAWIRNDLREHSEANMRIMALHHDPYRKDGFGDMWASYVPDRTDFLHDVISATKAVLDMGDGKGRLALLALMRRYNVALEISGHQHDDYVAAGALRWKDGTGAVDFVNTTSTQFQSDAESEKYPGYRRIWIGDGKVLGYNYKEPKWSYPWYRGTRVGEETDLGKLTEPAITSSFEPEPGKPEEVTLTLSNHLDRPLPDAFAEFPMPYLSGGYYYVAGGGVIEGSYDEDGSNPEHRTYQVRMDVPPRGRTEVTLSRSVSPDLESPTGSITLDGGLPSTDRSTVGLNIQASDGGGSGVSEMIVSNSPGFIDAGWGPYESDLAWELAGGAAGPRTVFVKLRDGSMPPNESELLQADIECAQATGGGRSDTVWYFGGSDNEEGWLTLANPGGDRATVQVSREKDGDEGVMSLVVDPATTLTLNISPDGAGWTPYAWVKISADRPVAAGIH